MDKPALIVSEVNGQLGNQLILFGHLIAFAKEYDFRVLNPGFHMYADQFEGTKQSCISAYPPDGKKSCSALVRKSLFRLTNLSARVVRRLPPGTFGQTSWVTTPGHTPEFDKDLSLPCTLERLRTKRFNFLFGWRYRNYALFDKHQEEIRSIFRPVDHADEIENFIQPLKSSHDLLFGVHIRHGDYASYQNGQYFLEVAQYARILESVMAEFNGSKVGVIIFSDQPQSLTPFDKFDAVNGPGNAVADMYSMALCDYILAVPSTFSRWASFYGNVPLATIDRNTRSVSLDQFVPAPC